MRFRDLFTVPTGQKVTEKQLRRVLISSICSILLCMSCLVSTTWAWFVVSIENTGNVIQIGTPEVRLTANGESFESGKELPAGKNEILIQHTNELDDLQKKSTLYVTLSVNNVVQGYVVLDSSNGYKTSITIETDKSYPFSWTASWFEPDTNPLTVNAINLISEEPDSTDGAAELDETTTPTETATPTESTTTMEAVTESSTETTTASSTEGTTPTTIPTTEDATEPSTETATTEATEATTETATIPTTTGETTEPSETTSATEETPIPDADVTTAPTTAPTSISTEAVAEPDGTTSPTGTADH